MTPPRGHAPNGQQPMERWHMWAFLGEVRKQAEIAATGHGSIAAEPGPADPWPSIQLFLSAAASISNLLWGSGPNAPSAVAKRVSLRAALGITDGSVLRSRTLRNHFEHVDERIDDWWDGGGEVHGRSMINYNDAPIAEIRTLVPDLADDELFRHFDRESSTLRFWGDSLELTPLAAEIERVGKQAEKAIKPLPIHEATTMM